MEKQKELIYILALHLHRKRFLESMHKYDKKTVVIGEEESDFISSLVLWGNFDEQVLHHVFALPHELIDQVREYFLN